METKEYRTVDKSTWLRGEWDDEPDKKQFTDEETGLPCLIVRGPHGGLCGYVGVAEGHKFHGVDYGQCPQKCKSGHVYCEHSPGAVLDVHGGITFAAFCADTDDESKHICHVPGPGEPDHVWWLGFDCAHSGDYSPGYAKEYPRVFSNGWGETYRDMMYVTHQVKKLAAQLAAIK